MTEYLNIIFGEVGYNVITPIAIVSIYAFSIVLESIAGIVQATFKAGGIK